MRYADSVQHLIQWFGWVSFIILEPYSHRSLCSTVLHIEKRPAAFMWAQHTVPHPQSPTAELHTQVECRLLLFRVLHCTGAVTPRSVFPLYVVNGSVRLGNSESVLTQQPYLSDSSPLSSAAGRICWCCCYTCVRPALQIAVVTTTCTSLHPSTPGAKRHVQQTMRAGTSSSHPDVSVWSVERAAASTSHASSFSKSNQPW